MRERKPKPLGLVNLWNTTMAPEDARFSAIICDDIRLEANGKFFIIGAYLDNLGAFEFPVDDTFCCVFRAENLADSIKKISIIMRHIGFEHNEKEYDISDRGDSTIAMMLTQVPVRANQPGEFFVEVRVDGSDPIVVERLLVTDANKAE